MSKELLNNFKENTKDFFLMPDDGSGKRQPNRQNIIAILIAGFVGWLVITVTFGAKLKAMVKKVPLLGSVFPKAKQRVARARTQVRKRYTRKK